jgi:hypothetical protein
MTYGDNSAGFTYRLDMLKPRASKFRGAPAKLCHLVNKVAIHIYYTHDYIRMEITVLYLKI